MTEQHSNGLILIADDNASSRQMVKRFLENEGYQVEEAEDGLNALSLCALVRPELIVLDALMPKMTGFEVCSRLSASSLMKHIPVLMLTSLDNDESVVRAFEAGAADYLTKPVNWAVLRQRVRRLLMAHQALIELEKERSLLRTVIDNVPDYIFVKDKNRRFVLSNLAHTEASRMSTPDDLSGKRASDVFPAPIAEVFESDDIQVIETGQPLLNVERTSVDKEGNNRAVLTTKVPLKDSIGNVVGMVGISRDISDRIQIEQKNLELTLERERMKALEKFVADVSHDFRTPLATINVTASLLRHQADDTQRHRVDIIQRQVDRLGTLLDNFLILTQLDSEPQLEFQKTDLNSIVSDLVVSMASDASEKKQTITLSLAPASLCIFADELELSRALNHIVQNAIQYTPDGGIIRLKTYIHEKFAVCEVQDNGMGISPQDLTHIFDRLYRADSARSTSTGGAGLGLPIAKKVIELHEGELQVESTLHQGSIFRIWLKLSY